MSSFNEMDQETLTCLPWSRLRSRAEVEAWAVWLYLSSGLHILHSSLPKCGPETTGAEFFP
jgi:hypothetical protein